MSASSVQESIEQFIELREAILLSLRQHKKSAGKASRSWQNITYLHHLFAGLSSYFIGIVALVQPFSVRVAAWGVALPLWQIFVVVLLIWTLIITSITNLVAKWVKNRWLFLLLYTSIGLPIFIALVESFVRQDWSGLTYRLIVFIPVYIAFFMVVGGLIFTTSEFFITLAFLPFTLMRGGRGGKVFPSYEALTRAVLEDIDPSIEKLNAAQIGEIRLVGEQKQSSINSSSSIVSLLFGILAVVGLIQLAIAQEQVTSSINNILVWIYRLIGSNEQSFQDVSGIQVIGAALVALVSFGLSYAMSVYRELRILDIMILCCTLQIHQRQTKLQASSTPQTASTNVINKSSAYLWSASAVFIILLGVARRLLRLKRSS